MKSKDSPIPAETFKIYFADPTKHGDFETPGKSSSQSDSPNWSEIVPGEAISSSGIKYDRTYWNAVRNGPFACLVFDVDSLDIVCASKLASLEFGFTPDELEHSDLSIIWPAEEFERRTRFIESTRTEFAGQSWGSMPFRTKNGEIFSQEFNFLDLDHPGRRLRVVFFPGLTPSSGLV